MSSATVILLFITLLITGFPVGYTMYLIAIAFFMTKGINLTAIIQKMGGQLTSTTLLSIPTFIFAGTLMNNVGMTNALFDSINKTPIGKLKGGLAQVNVVASLIFAGMSGAALADIGGLGKIEIQSMKNNGYSIEDSAGITMASSAIGPIFPPSIPLMMYSLYAQVSGIRLLMAGVVPALLLTLTLCLVVAYRAHKYDWPIEQFKGTLLERIKIIAYGIPAFCCPLILLGGMYSGKFAPSELACVAVMLAILLGFFFYKKCTFRSLWESSKEAVSNISRILFICGAGALFAYVITILKIPRELQKLITSLDMNPVALLITINFILLIVGMFMDCNIAIIVFTPLILPALVSMGIDPVHFGVVLCLNVVIGIFTPPFGTALFLGAIITDIPFGRLVKAMMPYYIPLVVILFVITIFPGLCIWLPNVIYG